MSFLTQKKNIRMLQIDNNLTDKGKKHYLLLYSLNYKSLVEKKTANWIKSLGLSYAIDSQILLI